MIRVLIVSLLFCGAIFGDTKSDGTTDVKTTETLIDRTITTKTKIDRNIVPNNVLQYYITVAAGGTYSIGLSVSSGTLTVDWGDGATTAVTNTGAYANKTHTYAAAGSYRLRLVNIKVLAQFYEDSTTNGAGPSWNLSIFAATSLNYFYCSGSNTVTGNLSSLPAGLTYFLCQGSNTVTGNLSSLPAGLTTFYCTGSNTIADYTGGRTWANGQRQFYIRQAAGSGFDGTEMDNILIDLANVATWAGSKSIDIRGVNAAPAWSAGAIAATNTLISVKGVTVLLN